MPIKKTASVKKKAAKKTTAAKSRPVAKKTASKGPAKKTAAKKSAAKKSSPAKKNVKNVKKPAKKETRGGFHREINEDTGFVVGTESDTIALELLEGGESRGDIVTRLEKMLDSETRNGTEKQITNMVSGVLNKMLAAGFTVEQSFVLVPPTPASKRKAARKK